MKLLKPLTALLIVLLGQNNIFIQNQLLFLEQLPQLYKKKVIEKFEEVEYHRKSKVSKLATQTVSRFRNNKQLALSWNLDKKDDQSTISSTESLPVFYKIPDRFNFSSIKSVWFGCCGRFNNLDGTVANLAYLVQNNHIYVIRKFWLMTI